MNCKSKGIWQKLQLQSNVVPLELTSFGMGKKGRY